MSGKTRGANEIFLLQVPFFFILTGDHPEQGFHHSNYFFLHEASWTSLHAAAARPPQSPATTPAYTGGLVGVTTTPPRRPFSHSGKNQTHTCAHRRCTSPWLPKEPPATLVAIWRIAGEDQTARTNHLLLWYATESPSLNLRLASGPFLLLFLFFCVR